MTRLIIRGASVLADDRWIEEATVLVADGRIEAVDSEEALGDAAGLDSPATIIDAPGLLLAPGFIELQTNGGFGSDLTAEPATMWELARHLPANGVTAFLPTIVTSPASTFDDAIAALAAPPGPDLGPAARPLGLHFEGPFLNPEKRGAHDPAYLRLPDATFAADWSLDAGVRLVTLAPELPGALDLAHSLIERGVVVSAGHSMATLAEARAGFDAGIRYGTHLFNAMPRLDHRAPGLAGALLHDERMTFGVIADGLHVDRALVALAWRLGAPRRFSIVTDQMAAAGAGMGEYRIGNQVVHATANGARLADGTLAGSLLTLDEALRNLVRFTGCSVAEAIAAVTTVPARLLSVERERGRIAPGLAGDLVLLTAGLEIVMTIVDGAIVYRAGVDGGAGAGADGRAAPDARVTVEDSAAVGAGSMAEGY